MFKLSKLLRLLAVFQVSGFFYFFLYILIYKKIKISDLFDSLDCQSKFNTSKFVRNVVTHVFVACNRVS